jgi:DNA repair protein RadA/Sms
MPKSTTQFTCQECQYSSTQWLGRCPQCGHWNSFQETLNPPTSKKRQSILRSSQESKLISLDQVNTSANIRQSTGNPEFDKVLGGGITPGSVILIGGEPGIGKSTLLLQVANFLASSQKVIYASGEESPQQVKQRADRLKIKSTNIILFSETEINQIIQNVIQQNPSASSHSQTPPVLIIDSIQTAYDGGADNPAASTYQIREVTAKLVDFAKLSNSPVIIIGHITKEGVIAGPKLLEHLVDTVIYFEGDRYSDLRIIRAVKNRFGQVNEIGMLEMTTAGLVPVANPSQLYLSSQAAAGDLNIATVILDGQQPIILEVQALTTKTYSPVPRRVAQGFDTNRLIMLTAILQKHLKLSLHEQDIFLNILGGVKLTDTAADLAVCQAILNSFRNITLQEPLVCIGEVGLQAEVRQVNKSKLRISEARKRGYQHILSSAKIKSLQDLTK